MADWISIEEMMPEKRKEVLTLSYCINLQEYVYNVGSLDETMGQFFSSEMGIYIHPTHWMPLPEPPK